MSCIDEEPLSFPLRRLDESGFQLVAEKLKLKLRIGLSRNRPALSAAHSQAFHQTSRLFLGESDSRERGKARDRILGRGRRHHGKGTAQTWQERLQSAARLVSPIFE